MLDIYTGEYWWTDVGDGNLVIKTSEVQIAVGVEAVMYGLDDNNYSYSDIWVFK